MSSEINGVGRLSVLLPLEESTTDVSVGFRKSLGSRDLPVTFEEAQNESGTGVYQIILLFVCGLVNMSCAISTTAVAFASPAIKKDFNLNSAFIGMLNGAPFFGMVFGAYFWGIYSDINGRRSAILGSMGMDTLFAIISCATQNFALFLIIRIGNGFAIIGASCMIYVYLGEFLTPNKRDSYLLYLEIFFALGMAIGPGIAMVIIPSNVVLLSYTYFKFNAWRVFIFLTSVPSLISFILIFQYPETPRYLMLKGHLIQSRDILEQIYFINNKNTTIPYSVESFTQTLSAIGFNSEFIGNMPFMTNLKIKLTSFKHGHTILFSKYYKNITVTCVIEFCLMASYITVLVWIPELFSRYYYFKVNNSDGTNICLASKWLLKYHSKPNKDSISTNTYLAALIVASSTIPLVIITGIIIKHFNKKILLFFSCGVPILMSLLIIITKNDVEAKVMCCVFEGFTALTEPIIFCSVVELFPSNVRGIAFSMTVMIGRIGAVFGIVIFGILIDKNCFLVFYFLAVLLLIAFMAVIFLPRLKIGGGH